MELLYPEFYERGILTLDGQRRVILRRVPEGKGIVVVKLDATLGKEKPDLSRTTFLLTYEECLGNLIAAMKAKEEILERTNVNSLSSQELKAYFSRLEACNEEIDRIRAAVAFYGITDSRRRITLPPWLCEQYNTDYGLNIEGNGSGLQFTLSLRLKN